MCVRFLYANGGNPAPAPHLSTSIRGLLAGLFLACYAAAQIPGGPGPSVMSRGGNSPGQRGVTLAEMTFYAGIFASYDAGVFAPVVDGEGAPQSLDLTGVAFNAGAYGAHSWRRSTLGFDYRGDYRHYVGSTYNNGSDHALGAEYRSTLTRRWEVVARQAAGTTSRPFGGFSAPSYISVDYISVPTTEIYNNRIYYGQTSVMAAYRKSARTMFTMGGGGFLTRRQSSALVNANGYNATGMVQRTVTRNLSVGAVYNYMRFSYPRAFGNSEIHGTSLTLERRLGRSSAVAFSAGAFRLETLGSESFLLRPEIAAILGRPTGVRVFHRVNYMSQLGATITYRRRNIGYNAGYTRGASPGNGVYLTSQTEAMTAGISYAGIRRASFGINAGHTRMKSMWQAAEQFRYSYAGCGMSYSLGRGLNWTGQADWRRISAGQTINGRSGFVFTSGLAFSSSPVPLSLW